MKALSPYYRHPRPKRGSRRACRKLKGRTEQGGKDNSFGDLSSCTLNENSSSINNSWQSLEKTTHVPVAPYRTAVFS